MARTCRLERKTTETQIKVELSLDGQGKADINTGIAFLDHMLTLFCVHGQFDLDIQAKGDLEVDYHHTVEDVGLALGEALNTALGNRQGITRYGWSLVPMDEALSRVAIDLGGRPYLVYDISSPDRMIRDFDAWLLKHFFESMVQQSRMNLHIAQLYADDVHHAYESVFKGVARALRIAVAIDPREKGVPSSKGVL